MTTRPWPVLVPLRNLLTAMEAESDPFRRAWRLIDTFEWAIKWCTAVVVGDVMDTAAVPRRLRGRLVASLGRPSLGSWVGFLRDALDAVPDQRPWRDWDRVLDLDQRRHIVSFRNAYAHGAVEPDHVAQRHVDEHEPDLHHLLASPFFHEVGLLVAGEGNVRSLGGPRPPSLRPEVKGTFAWTPDVPGPISLWPLAVHLEATLPGRSGVYFHNGLRKRRVEELNYDLPDRMLRQELYDPLLARVPLDAWRAEQQTDLNPYGARLATLSSGLVGREDDASRLAARAAHADGETVVLGPPGQGKSALMAAVDVRLRQEQDEHVVVLDTFLRSADAGTEPTHVLRSWVARLARYLDVPVRPRDTPADLHDQLQGLLRQWGVAGRRRLVLLVDALDERPAMLGHLPLPTDRTHVLWSARPVAHVVDAVKERGVPAAGRVAVPPLTTPDVRALLYQVVDKLDPRLTAPYVTAVAARAGGNPLFLDALVEEMHHDSTLIGDLGRVPARMADLFDRAMDRVTDGGRREHTIDVLHLLAIAQDHLGTSELSALLESRASRVRHEVKHAHELLHEDDEGRLALYHEALREWLASVHRDEVEEIEERVAELYVEGAPRSASTYLDRHGLAHVGNVARVRPDLLRGLVDQWSSPGTVTAHVERRGPMAAIEDRALAHDLALDHGVAVDGLVSAVVEWQTSTDHPGIDPDVLHAALMYRSDLRFTDAVLEGVVARAIDDRSRRRAMESILAGRLRRRGGREDRARARGLLADLDQDAEGSSVVDVRVAYDLAYLDHLEDRPEHAMAGFSRAVERAETVGDSIGRWIAACVRAQVAYLAGQRSAAEYRGVLQHALSHFHAAESDDPGAARWVTNVAAHRFDVALDTGDGEDARAQLDQLTRHPWVHATGRGHMLQLRRARLAVREGQAGEAIEVLQDRVASGWVDGQPTTRENLARDHLDLGLALAGARQTQDALTVWQDGLRCPTGGAAWAWRPRLRNAIRTHA